MLNCDLACLAADSHGVPAVRSGDEWFDTNGNVIQVWSVSHATHHLPTIQILISCLAKVMQMLRGIRTAVFVIVTACRFLVGNLTADAGQSRQTRVDIPVAAVVVRWVERLTAVACRNTTYMLFRRPSPARLTPCNTWMSESSTGKAAPDFPGPHYCSNHMSSCSMALPNARGSYWLQSRQLLQ